MKRRVAGNLGEEIIFQQILTRVSAKSLITFKCVSKHWNKSISSPWFVKLHLDHFRSLPPGKIKIPYNETGNLGTPFFHDPKTKEQFEIAMENSANQRMGRLATCDGMVFVETRIGHQNYSHYILNPVTRYILRLPSPPATWSYAHHCVFVFDDSINQYKVLLWNSLVDLHSPHDPVDHSEEICSIWTLGTDSSWRNMTLPGGAQSITCSPVRVDRKIYWVSMNRSQGRRVLLTMDVSTEEIREFELPCRQNPERAMVVMEMNGLLYFISSACIDFHCYIIWVLEDLDTLKWTKLYQKTNPEDEYCDCSCDPGYSVIDEDYEYGEIELKAKDICEVDVEYWRKIEHFNSLICLENMQPGFGLRADNSSDVKSTQ